MSCLSDEQGSTYALVSRVRKAKCPTVQGRVPPPKDSPTQNDSSASSNPVTENIALRKKNQDKENPINPTKGKKRGKLYKKAKWHKKSPSLTVIPLNVNGLTSPNKYCHK